MPYEDDMSHCALERATAPLEQYCRHARLLVTALLEMRNADVDVDEDVGDSTMDGRMDEWTTQSMLQRFNASMRCDEKAAIEHLNIQITSPEHPMTSSELGRHGRHGRYPQI